MTIEYIRLGVRVDCISFDYTNSTMLPSEMKIHKRDGLSNEYHACALRQALCRVILRACERLRDRSG